MKDEENVTTREFDSAEELTAHIGEKFAELAKRAASEKELRSVVCLVDTGEFVVVSKIGHPDSIDGVVRRMVVRRSSLGSLALAFSLGMLAALMML